MKNNVKEATLTQFNLFDEPTVTKLKKQRPKMSEREKEERREKRALEKIIKRDRAFEEYWAKRGVIQGRLFSEEELDNCENKKH